MNIIIFMAIMISRNQNNGINHEIHYDRHYDGNTHKYKKVHIYIYIYVYIYFFMNAMYVHIKQVNK